MGGPAFNSKQVSDVTNFAIRYGGLLKAACVYVSTVDMFEMLDNAGTIATLK